jgi:chromate reductase, NAD(P)H dehydrogenase (quinone)
MASDRDITVFVLGGSLRRESLNQHLAALARRALEARGVSIDFASISDFVAPHYDQDDEAASGIPAGVQQFAERLRQADAFILSSPEYNASMPGVVKNLIDWASRIRPQPFNGKQALLMSASPSMAGGNRGLWSLRIPLEHLGMRVYPDMFSLAQAHQAFTEDGSLRNEVLQKRFDQTIDCFCDLVEAATHYRGLKKQWVEFLGEHPDAATDRVETSLVDAA